MATQRTCVLGIAAKRSPVGTFGEQASYLRGLVRIARRASVVAYVFEPQALARADRSVRGWTPAGRGWARRSFPHPTVIYDRVWGVTPEVKARFEERLLRLWTEEGIPSFNPPFRDKLAIHEILSTSPALGEHLPATLPLSAESVAALFADYDTLYVKPILGRQGKGIARCTRRGGRYLIVRRGASGRTLRASVTSPEEVVRASTGGASPRAFLVQRGLPLVRIGSGSVDIRVIVQRNGRGEWSVTGMGVRVGASGGIVSNLHAGGKAFTLSKMQRAAGIPRAVRHLRTRVERVAMEAVTTLGAHLPHLGEVGVDIGLAKDGSLWIIEINRQPGRALFARAKLYAAWRRSRRRIIEYALYLAKVGAEYRSPLHPPPYDGR